MRSTGIRRTALVFAIALLPVLAGCGSNPFNPPIDPGGDGHVPGDTPDNNSPQNLVIRFEKTYEFQDLPNYEKLLTSDFRYTFSSASDPGLVAQYGNNWGKDDEVESSKHLFEGFTNSTGDVIPAASKIDMTLSGIQYGTDPFHSDSTAYYQKVVLSSVVMEIDVPATPEPIVYNISARHELYLVRGDAARLDANQEARNDRWYIYRWDDLSTPLAAGIKLASTNDGYVLTRTTWGTVKDKFAH